MTTPQPAALPECIAHVEDWPDDRTPIGLVWDVDPASVPVGTKLYALAALQPQPQPAAVSDAEINRIVWEHTRLNPNQAADSGLMLCIRNAARAILALQPQPAAAVSDEQIRHDANLPFVEDEHGAEWVTLSPAMFARSVRRVLALRPQAESDEAQITDYQEALASVDALVRRLDVAINGNNAAPQARLCDIVSQVEREGLRPQAVPMTEAWNWLTEANIDAYLEDYEMRGEGEDGRDACYTPTEGDRALIKDFVMGLLAEAQEAAHHGITAQGAQGGEG